MARALGSAALVCALFMPSHVASSEGTFPAIRLATPPLWVEGADAIYCNAVNLHTVALDVDIEVFNAAGERVCGAGVRTLAPGEAQAQPCNSDIGADPNPLRYCLFTYHDRNRRLIHGSAQAVVSFEGKVLPVGSAVPATFIDARFE